MTTVALSSCWRSSEMSLDTPGGGDADNDTDVDTDSDADSDADTDSEGDTEEWPEPNDDPLPLCWATMLFEPADDIPEIVDMVALDDGSTVTTGFFEHGITFAPGEAEETCLEPVDETDVFLAHHDELGVLTWARGIGGPAEVTPAGLAAETGGGFLITGHFFDTLDFGDDEVAPTVLTAGEEGSAFVARYTAAGDLDLALAEGGADGASGQGIAAFADGSFVLAGKFSWEITLGSDGPSETTLTTDGGSGAVFVARYDGLGELLWAEAIQGSVKASRVIATTPDGSLLLVGTSYSWATFAQGEPGETTCVTQDDFNQLLFVARYDQAGGFEWAACAEAHSAEPEGGALLGDGSFVLGGDFSKAITFDGDIALEGPTEGNTSGAVHFVARYGSDGSALWAVTNYNPSIHNQLWCAGLGATPDDQILIGGGVSGWSIFNYGTPDAIAFKSPFNNADGFIAGVALDGTTPWANRVASGWESGSVHRMVVHGDGTATATGTFRGVGELAVEGDETIVLDAGDATAGFVFKYCP